MDMNGNEAEYARETLEILFADSHLVAINKPAGLIVHRSTLASDSVTCASLLQQQIGDRMFPIHRLDRGASGVLVFARTSEIGRAHV